MGSEMCIRDSNCTVTQVHSKSQNVKELVKQADIVVAAVGVPRLVEADWIKPGAVVIDVGTNYVPDATKKSGQRLVGDVNYESVVPVAAAITPVPGGAARRTTLPAP